MTLRTHRGKSKRAQRNSATNNKYANQIANKTTELIKNGRFRRGGLVDRVAVDTERFVRFSASVIRLRIVDIPGAPRLAC